MREGSSYRLEAAFGRNPESSQESEQHPVRSAEITIVGSPEADAETNREVMGREVAQRLADVFTDAQAAGKPVLFDMATGSSPKAVWPELQRMAKEGAVDLNGVAVMGHEEAWGSYEPGSKSDFDAYRRREFFERNGITVKPITSVEGLETGTLPGNFLPMHVSENPAEAAQRYAEMIRVLQHRPDVVTIGLYGVGTEGHIADLQPQHSGITESQKRKETYPDTMQVYSVEKGAFRWSDGADGFRPEDNIFWQRGARAGEDVGRAVWQGYGGIDQLTGLGWKELLRQERIMILFNDTSKSLAFDLALDGAMNGTIVGPDGNPIRQLERKKGEGEEITPELATYVRELGLHPRLEATVSELFRAAYEKLDAEEATSDDPRYKQLWTFTNRYVGRRAPVARLLRLRTLLGRKTELIATPEAIRGSTYANTFLR